MDKRCRERYNSYLQRTWYWHCCIQSPGKVSPLDQKFLLTSLSKTAGRFQAANLEHNTTMFTRVSEIATRKGCTPSQLALAWVHHQGNDVCPIPDTTKIKNFNQNIGALSVKLTPEEMAELESIGLLEVKGDRYQPGIFTWRDSDTPPLSSWKAN